MWVRKQYKCHNRFRGHKNLLNIHANVGVFIADFLQMPLESPRKAVFIQLNAYLFPLTLSERFQKFFSSSSIVFKLFSAIQRLPSRGSLCSWMKWLKCCRSSLARDVQLKAKNVRESRLGKCCMLLVRVLPERCKNTKPLGSEDNSEEHTCAGMSQFLNLSSFRQLSEPQFCNASLMCWPWTPRPGIEIQRVWSWFRVFNCLHTSCPSFGARFASTNFSDVRYDMFARFLRNAESSILVSLKQSDLRPEHPDNCRCEWTAVCFGKEQSISDTDTVFLLIANTFSLFKLS